MSEFPVKRDCFETFRSWGCPQLVVAPMVDQSELSFRMLTRKYGAQLVFTQMYNANSFVSSSEYREQGFTTCPEDRPLIVQFCGHEPLTMLKAAKYVEDRCDAVDINLGCPQDIARRGRYGAYLMEELDLLAEMVSTLKNNLKVPVTCKTRIYKDFDKSIRLCETLVQAGASMLTIHGRTREEKGHKVGPADWHMIARIRSHFAGRVPIIANGGIESSADIPRCLQVTGADGVMSSEAILENPALFSGSSEEKTQLDLAEEYLEMCEKYGVWQLKCVRAHLMKLLHRYLSVHTDLRTELATCGSVEEMAEVFKRIREKVELSAAGESGYVDCWYRRHRNVEVLHSGCSVGGDKAVSTLQLAMDQNKSKLWNNLDESETGLFQSLGMFDDSQDSCNEDAVSCY